MTETWLLLVILLLQGLIFGLLRKLPRVIADEVRRAVNGRESSDE